MAEHVDTAARSMLNRLAGISAGQEQLQKDVDKLRGDVKALLILGAYAAAIALLTFLAVRYGEKMIP